MEQWAVRFNDSFQHYGVKGMKWGVRKDKKVVKDYDVIDGSLLTRSRNRVQGFIPASARAGQSVGEYFSKAADSGKKWLEKTLNIKHVTKRQTMSEWAEEKNKPSKLEKALNIKKTSKTTPVVIDDSPAKKKNFFEKIFNVKEGDAKVTRWTADGKEEYIKYKKNK